jgi:hypothetical protein
MGLEIFYDLHAPAWNHSKVRQIVLAARRHASTLGFEEVDQMKRNDPARPQTMGVRRSRSDLGYVSASAEDGWFFRTWPGEGCETAIFGLCRFPARVHIDGRTIAFGWGEGWHFHSGCKTQYADLVSRAHFLKCHLGIISILEFFQSAGCLVRVRDGGDFWKTRRVERLTRRLENMHAVVAAVAGTFKDAADNLPGKIIAPITRRADFERLEAEGRMLLARRAARKQSPKR